MPDAWADATDRLPEDVRSVIERYLALVDHALPGRIEILYLVGSVALDDYQAGQSDVDFVALAAFPLSEEELGRLDGVHRALLSEVGRPWFDGLYLTAADLTQSPDVVRTAPHVLEGRFDGSRGFEANPAVWLTLRNHPCPVRGQLAAVWHDAEHLRRWTENNLKTYWAGLASQLEAAAPRLDDGAASRAIAWCVPGVARLAYTLATGDVTSKSRACEYVLETCSERWHALARHAIALRSGQRISTSAAMVEDAIALMRQVIETADASRAATETS